MVEVEINKKLIIIMEKEKALEFAVNEYFTNGRSVKINGKIFDILNYGNQELAFKLA